MPPAPPPLKLLVSLLARGEEARALAVRQLAERFGPLDYLSRPLDFGHSSYYDSEMGPGLTRRVAGFRRLVDGGGLALVKRVCMSLEGDLAEDGRRRVNLDPGLLGADSLVLATTKHRGHRVEIAPGLFADIMLFFHEGGFRPLAWTYPDFAGDELRSMLMDLRRRYLWQLKRESSAGGER